MKKFVQVFVFVLLTTIVHSQLTDEGPKAYFGYVGIDSMKRSELLRYDTLKMDNQNLKVLRFIVALSTYDCKNCTNDVAMVKIAGNAISDNKKLFKALKIKQTTKTLFTVIDIEFINSKGKFIKYPKEFSFKLYE
jgi:hypothetical protein